MSSLDSLFQGTIVPASFENHITIRMFLMAKSATVLVKLTSTADTGFYYVTKKNPRNQTEKLEFRKYDPVARKHVLFKEGTLRPSRIRGALGEAPH